MYACIHALSLSHTHTHKHSKYIFLKQLMFINETHIKFDRDKCLLIKKV